MKARRWGAGLVAGAALVAWSMGPAMADDTPPPPDAVQIAPAPPGTGEAVAVQIGPISIGHTSATAGPSADGNDSQATANAVEIGGSAPDSHVGGQAKGKGQKKGGAILDSGDTPLGRLALAPWNAAVDGDGTPGSPRTADSDAALARLILVNSGVLAVNVAQSESHARHDGTNSTGSASSDGATLSLADQIKLVVLHSEATSDGKGKSYLVSINGNEVGTSDQAAGGCALAVPQVATVSCLSASGGNGTVNAVVAQAGITPLNQGATLVAAKGTSASGNAVAAAPEPAPAAEPGAPAAAVESPRGSTLARTGAAIAGLALLGVALTAIGAGLLAVRRRLGPAPVAG